MASKTTTSKAKPTPDNEGAAIAALGSIAIALHRLAASHERRQEWCERSECEDREQRARERAEDAAQRKESAKETLELAPKILGSLGPMFGLDLSGMMQQEPGKVLKLVKDEPAADGAAPTS